MNNIQNENNVGSDNNNNSKNTVRAMNMNNQNVANNNSAVGLNQNINTSKQTLIQRFKQFIESYSKITDFDPKKLDNYGMTILANSAFKKHGNYDKEDPVSGKYFIDDNSFANFCVDNSTNNIININLDDDKFAELIKIYKDMKTMYITNCGTLLETLEKNILIKVPENEDDKSPKFTLKDLNYSELIEQETNVRNQLGQMYALCHEQYQAGISALYNALKKEPDTTGL